MSTEEAVLVFRAGGDALFGVLHPARQPSRMGVVILVGGPQYRVGSHRMFVQMARELAAHDYPVLRFDFAGMGDSDGTFPGFERLDRDIAAAIDALGKAFPTIESYVLVGLCDGATAAAYYAPADSRVAGIVLLNPWVHTQAGEAKAYLWYYYPRRLFQLEFWRWLFGGRVAVRAALADLFRKVGRAFVRRSGGSDFVERMRSALGAFRGRLLVVASGNDLTAAEFVDLWQRDGRWGSVRDRAQFVPLAEADHTLSSRDSMTSFCGTVCRWLAEVRPTREA